MVSGAKNLPEKWNFKIKLSNVWTLFNKRRFKNRSLRAFKLKKRPFDFAIKQANIKFYILYQVSCEECVLRNKKLYAKN